MRDLLDAASPARPPAAEATKSLAIPPHCAALSSIHCSIYCNLAGLNSRLIPFSADIPTSSLIRHCSFCSPCWPRPGQQPAAAGCEEAATATPIRPWRHKPETCSRNSTGTSRFITRPENGQVLLEVEPSMGSSVLPAPMATSGWGIERRPEQLGHHKLCGWVAGAAERPEPN
jgi:hypothetical protein